MLTAMVKNCKKQNKQTIWKSLRTPSDWKINSQMFSANKIKLQQLTKLG